MEKSTVKNVDPDERVPVTIRMRRPVYIAIGIAAKIKNVTVGEWIEDAALPLIPPAFRKGLAK